MSNKTLLDLLMGEEAPGGWRLVNDEYGSGRMSMLPLGTYERGTYPGGASQKRMGVAMPAMISEPYNALMRQGAQTGYDDGQFRFPDPRDEQNSRDSETLVWSLFGGNAVKGAMAKSPAVRNGLAHEPMTADVEVRNAARNMQRSSTQPTEPYYATPPETPLPMDHASRLRRAKDLGFDTEKIIYHGSGTTSVPFDKFDPSFFGQRDSFWGPGIHAGDEATAQTYTFNPDLTGPLGPNQYGHYRALYSRANRPFDFERNWPDNIKEIFPEYDSSAGMAVKATQGSAFVEALKSNGYDHIRSSDGNHNVYLNPEQLRDVNAVFDPARAGESGLLLSDTGKPSLLGSALAAEQAPQDDIPDWLLQYLY